MCSPGESLFRSEISDVLSRNPSYITRYLYGVCGKYKPLNHHWVIESFISFNTHDISHLKFKDGVQSNGMFTINNTNVTYNRRVKPTLTKYAKVVREWYFRWIHLLNARPLGNNNVFGECHSPWHRISLFKIRVGRLDHLAKRAAQNGLQENPHTQSRSSFRDRKLRCSTQILGQSIGPKFWWLSMSHTFVLLHNNVHIKHSFAVVRIHSSPL